MISKSRKPLKKSKVRVSSKVKDYGNDPFFVDKARQSKEFLDKNGFPKEVLERK